MNYKQLANDLLDYLVEMVDTNRTIGILKMFGYTDDEIKELGLEEEEYE
jgi:hypothetical protein